MLFRSVIYTNPWQHNTLCKVWANELHTVDLIPENYNWFLRLNNRRRTTTPKVLRELGYTQIELGDQDDLFAISPWLRDNLPRGSYIDNSPFHIHFAEPQHAAQYTLTWR